MTTMTTQTNGRVAKGDQRQNLWFTPRFDIWENDNEYVLRGDLPGVEPNDLDVTYENQELTIHGKVAPRGRNARYFAEEYGVGDFHRSFTIGELIDEAAINADMKDGVLTVHLPKRAEARPRKITVKTE
jgi:HSP20 family protein